MKLLESGILQNFFDIYDKSKTDVVMLSIKHTSETLTVTRRLSTIDKPVTCKQYNGAESAVDLSDQMSSYSSISSRNS